VSFLHFLIRFQPTDSAEEPYFLVFVLILLGQSSYPRWAGVAMPFLFVVIAFPPFAHLPVWATAILGPARWNIGGAAAFAASTAILWNHDNG